ncbi:OLC1v1000316C2 [Oldenlandia corymbosa var. corymbosa]|uniref:OLC1v1000316C2 n=1 Tax=Oldenlandia corymbosa var. corymbosa TaxID=529605 RepID=A0AAV1D5K3_OLDCO|nr:OLC1v1000316C2 [Oldenlandia corymbosa var. corymbosa]
MGSLTNLSLLKRRTFSIWKSMNSTTNATEKPLLASSLSNITHHLHPGPGSFISYGRNLSSRGKSLVNDASQGPAAIDYRKTSIKSWQIQQSMIF